MVVAVSDPIEQYRLALSYVDKVQREKEKWTRIVDSQPTKVTRFDSVAASYRNHERLSAALQKAIWKPHHKQLPDLQNTLRKKAIEQKRIVGQLQQGKIKPQKANELNRGLAKEMIALQEAVHLSQAIVNAQSAADLGGLIELPIDEYAPRIDSDYKKHLHDDVSIKNSLDPSLIRKAIGVFICIAALWGGWTYYNSLGKATFSITPVEGRSNAMEVSCKNNGNERIKVYAPWPGGITVASEREKYPRRSFGIQLYVKEKGKNTFRLLPSSQGAWFRGRDPMSEGTAVNIPANRIRKIRFEPEGLKEIGIEAAAVRLVITRHGGREFLDYEAKIRN